MAAVAVLTGYEFHDTLTAAWPDYLVDHLHEFAGLMGLQQGEIG